MAKKYRYCNRLTNKVLYPGIILGVNMLRTKQTFMLRFSLLFLFVYSFQVGYSQNKKVYKSPMQTCDCIFKIDSSYMASVPPQFKSDSTFPYKIDSSFHTICGYLIVPENRKKASSKMIRLPFIVLKSKSPDKQKDPFLFTTGGPGGSSLGWITSLSRHCEKDSSDQQRFGSLATKFENYFNSIADKKFYFPYLEKGTVDTIQIEYTKNELLDILDYTLQDASAIKNVPFMITEMIKGNHTSYIQKKLDDIFNRNIAPNGMRMSVYCADQPGYHSEEVIQQLWQLYPFLRGYHINDVYNAVCDCWKVSPISVQTRQPYYSNKPVLIGDGEMDPACSPLYMYRIKHYMPNAQCFLFINKSHGVGGTSFRQMTQTFLDHPYNRIESPNEKIIAY
jgi:hypothetical protein